MSERSCVVNGGFFYFEYYGKLELFYMQNMGKRNTSIFSFNALN